MDCDVSICTLAERSFGPLSCSQGKGIGTIDGCGKSFSYSSISCIMDTEALLCLFITDSVRYL